MLTKVGIGSTFIYFALAIGLSGGAGLADEGARQVSVKPLVIRAKPKFARHGGLIDLIIGDTNAAYAVPWSIEGRTPFTRVLLESNRVYAFTVDKEFFVDCLSDGLLRVEADGRMIYDVAICELHKVKMELKEGRLIYGRLNDPEPGPSGDWELWTFPHRREYAFRGCLAGPDSPETTRIYVCSQCRAAYEKWKRDKASGPYAELALKSVSDSEPRLALINNKTFAAGEKAKVRLGDGRVTVECVEIDGGSVRVRVGDEREVRELELQGGLRCIFSDLNMPSAAESLRRSRLALVDDQVLVAVGEWAEVTVGGKRVTAECVEIRDAAVTVRVGDDRDLRKFPAKIVRQAVR